MLPSACQAAKTLTYARSITSAIMLTDALVLCSRRTHF